MIRLQQEPLSNHTTFRIGGPALHYLIPETMEEVSEALDFARSNHYPFYVIGKGSNMLFSDEGYPGVIIEIGKGLEEIQIDDDGVVTAQAGITLRYSGRRHHHECRGLWW